MYMYQRAVLVLVLSLLATARAQADPYTILPNGDLLFDVSMRSSGVFGCPAHLPCTGSGTNAITLGTGSATATLRFTGVEAEFQAGNVVTPVTVGAFELFGSPDFTFPVTNPFAPAFSFTLTIDHTSPVEDSGSIRWVLGQNGRLLIGSDWLGVSAGPNPPGYAYTGIVYTFSQGQIGNPGLGNAQNVVANVGVVPEPATLLLMSTGMAGLAWTRRRTRIRRD